MTDEMITFFLALQSEKPRANLARLAIHLKNSGVSKDEALEIFQRFREAVGCDGKDASEQQDRVDDVILDTMDYIFGWCTPEASIYSKNFDETTFWKWFDAVKWSHGDKQDGGDRKQR